MTERDRDDINRIILFKNQIKEIDSFLMKLGKQDITTKVVFEKSYKVKFLPRYSKVEWEYELTDVLLYEFMNYLHSHKKHLQNLIDEYVSWKVEMADAIINEEITKEGA